MSAEEFYIADLRLKWRGKPYITLWRPNDAGYAWPLPWAGRYSREDVDANPAYYASRRYGAPRAFDRFPVPCDVVERLATTMPPPGRIDGDVGPVLLNDASTRRALQRAKYVPSRVQSDSGRASECARSLATQGQTE